MPSEFLTATHTPTRVVMATLNYLRPRSEKPMRYLYDQPGLPEWTGVNDPRTMPITDAREHEGSFTLDQNGFELLNKPSVEQDFKDESAITGANYDECAAIVRGATGAARLQVLYGARRAGAAFLPLRLHRSQRADRCPAAPEHRNSHNRLFRKLSSRR